MRDNLSRKGEHWIRLENAVDEGTPDVNGCFDSNEVWIELKALHEWPKRASTPVRLNHFKDCQRQWLVNRWLSGGNAWLFVRVAREYFLFSAPVALKVDTLTRQHWYDVSRAHYKTRIDWQHFRGALCRSS